MYLLEFIKKISLPGWYKLSQPNNNHNSKNKTTNIVVELRLTNRWEPPPTPLTTINSKLQDRAEIEQYSENKSY